MPMGLIAISKTWAGSKPWSNTYAFKTDNFIGLNDTVLTDIGASGILDDGTTKVGGAGFTAATASLLQCILAFERAIHYSPVNFTKIAISDGSKNSGLTDIGPLASVFASIPVNFNGVLDTAGLDNAITPGNIALRVLRVPSGFSAKPGTLWYRACLADANVKIGGPKLITWENDASRTVITNRINDAQAASGLYRFFSAGGETIQVGIPHTRKGVQIPPLDEGDLYAVSTILGFQVSAPASRQVVKGRKRPV